MVEGNGKVKIKGKSKSMEKRWKNKKYQKMIHSPPKKQQLFLMYFVYWDAHKDIFYQEIYLSISVKGKLGPEGHIRIVVLSEWYALHINFLIEKIFFMKE